MQSIEALKGTGKKGKRLLLLSENVHNSYRTGANAIVYPHHQLSRGQSKAFAPTLYIRIPPYI